MIEKLTGVLTLKIIYEDNVPSALTRGQTKGKIIAIKDLRRSENIAIIKRLLNGIAERAANAGLMSQGADLDVDSWTATVNVK